MGSSANSPNTIRTLLGWIVIGVPLNDTNVMSIQVEEYDDQPISLNDENTHAEFRQKIFRFLVLEVGKAKNKEECSLLCHDTLYFWSNV